MKSPRNHITLLYVLTLLLWACNMVMASCNGERHDYAELDSLNALALKEPLLSLRKINERSPQYERKGSDFRMRLCLLRIKAEDKCYINHGSDAALDSIRRLQAYFEKNGTLREKMDACYYLGGSYRDRQDYTQAFRWYKKVIGIAAGKTLTFSDSCTLTFTYSQLSGLSDAIDDHASAYRQMKTSFELQKRLHIADFRTYKDMAQAARDLNKMDEAERNYQACFVLLLEDGIQRQHEGVLGELLSFYVNRRNSYIADLIKGWLFSLGSSSLQSNASAALANYYENLKENNDSALYYTLQAFSCEERVPARANLAKRAAHLYEVLGDEENALAYVHQYFDLCSAEKTRAERRAHMAKTMLELYEKAETSSKKADAYSERLRYSHVIIFAILILSITCIGIGLYREKRWKRRESNRYEIIEGVKARNEELTKQNQELEGSLRNWEQRKTANEELQHLQDFLRDKEYALNNALHPEDWLQVFTVVNRMCPTFRQDILNLSPHMSDSALIFLYLMKLGKSRASIARILEKSPSNVGRAISKIEAQLGKTAEEAIGIPLD